MRQLSQTQRSNNMIILASTAATIPYSLLGDHEVHLRRRLRSDYHVRGGLCAQPRLRLAGKLSLGWPLARPWRLRETTISHTKRIQQRTAAAVHHRAGAK